MVISNYKFDGNKLSLSLKGKEDLIGTYYISDYQELIKLKDIIKYGVSVKIYGSLNIPSNNTIPNTFNYRKYLNNKDIFYTLKIDNIEVIDNNISIINRIKNIINNRIEKIDKTGYMKAFILGNKDDIDSEIYNNYQKIGITHLFALSGMHVGLLSGIILKLLKKINIIKRYLIVDILLIVYGFIVGYPSSIKRCILFFIFNSINKIFKLDISPFKLLLLVIFSLIFYEYKIIYDIGFIYSICTVGGIILCNNFINHDNKLISSFRLSLVAFIFSLPISLSNFYEVNLLSIFYNMIFVPYVSIIVYPLSLLVFLIPSLSNVFSFFINVMEMVSEFLSSIRIFSIYLNLNIIEVFIFYLVSVFMFIKNKYKLFFLLALIIIIDIIVPYLDSSAYVYFFDVGQGDSSLIISPYRKDIILIDTGGLVSSVSDEWTNKSNYYVSDGVINYMKSIGIKSIELLILSHGDYDHMGEAINLVENYKVDKVIFNCGPYNELKQELIKVLDMKEIPYYSCIKELNIDDNKLYFLNNKDYGNENDNSSVIYTELNNHKFLFMGDASVDVEKDLIEKYNLNDIDVLKVGHHGSKTSSGEEFIDEINPKYSIISVGKNNRYGHPNKEVLENLEDSKIYRTDQDGSIMFKIKNNKLEIETCSP